MRMRSTVPIAKPSSSDRNRARAMRRKKRVTPERVGQPAAILFAYGTLRRGAPMHGLLEGRTNWIGAASVAGRLVDLGAFPGLIEPQAPGDRVHGDLFAIAEAQRDELLDALDRYEGASFERVQQLVDGPDGPARAWLYVYRGEVDGRPVLAGGDYLA
jgi:gamma-glutamylcyclotransferase (GGCT)/AIG2-like uncharacterized protein YtfP